MTTGQINLNTKLGNIIYNLVYFNKFKNIVDVGTWNGLGTTYCVLKALEDKNELTATNLYTVELYPEMVEIAKKNLSKYLHLNNFKMLNGSMIDFNEVYWFDHSSIDFNNDMHAKLWYEKDIQNLKNSKNIFNELPNNIDLLILDGGEYSTYPEWKKLESRVKYFVLDDSNILKCNKIRQEVLQNKNIEILHDVQNDRNGYVVGHFKDQI